MTAQTQTWSRVLPAKAGTPSWIKRRPPTTAPTTRRLWSWHTTTSSTNAITEPTYAGTPETFPVKRQGRLDRFQGVSVAPVQEFEHPTPFATVPRNRSRQRRRANRGRWTKPSVAAPPSRSLCIRAIGLLHKGPLPCPPSPVSRAEQNCTTGVSMVIKKVQANWSA